MTGDGRRRCVAMGCNGMRWQALAGNSRRLEAMGGDGSRWDAMRFNAMGCDGM